ncbi:hypothetical protein [Pontiella agarivorans]|uniref:Uncharacterized protein n=1 Tax=Pontiella agarivorans TaxID=3038953 RepID=A0ABU5MYU8_9BACT|nr:hypothetical protein [Pontiella agarivorans]MDZ8119266.1 hypothetical protein [Pontiella agarivorans]
MKRYKPSVSGLAFFLRNSPVAEKEQNIMRYKLEIPWTARLINVLGIRRNRSLR